MRKTYRVLALSVACMLFMPAVAGIGTTAVQAASDETIILRVNNWEEYIDQGDWDDEEAIDLESETIFSENGVVEDFEEWYYETYGQRVQVEYSTFGTNEDLYSQLSLGDTYDLVCPSDYMIMKLMKEDALVPLSDEFFDESNEYNYYVNGVSPYIENVFDTNEIDGEAWSKYAAGYMWGITGVLYNPDEVSVEDASTWSILINPEYSSRVTIKDNVRDAYFPTLAIINRDLLMSPEFIGLEDYSQKLSGIMNDTSHGAIQGAENILKDIKENVYSFETDSGKADMVTGKVVANLQWSGDAVYAMDQAEEDDLYLDWAVPEECTNLWFDGWVMLKSGIDGDENKQHAAEAFINFVSRPDNVVRNMYFIGYTSVIAGGDSPLVYEYAEWCYGAEDDEEDTAEYSVGYFFGGDEYVITTPAEQVERQLFAQYPTEDVINRSAVMLYFDDEANININQMWINIRCFNLDRLDFGTVIKTVLVIGAAALIVLLVVFRHRVFRKPIPKGYKRIK